MQTPQSNPPSLAASYRTRRGREIGAVLPPQARRAARPPGWTPRAKGSRAETTSVTRRRAGAAEPRTSVAGGSRRANTVKDFAGIPGLRCSTEWDIELPHACTGHADLIRSMLWRGRSQAIQARSKASRASLSHRGEESLTKGCDCVSTGPTGTSCTSYQKKHSEQSPPRAILRNDQRRIDCRASVRRPPGADLDEQGGATARAGGRSYEWVSPSDYGIAEVRLLHDAGAVGEVHADQTRAKDNLLIRGEALNALTVLTRLPEFEREYVGNHLRRGILPVSHPRSISAKDRGTDCHRGGLANRDLPQRSNPTGCPGATPFRRAPYRAQDIPCLRRCDGGRDRVAGGQ